MKEYDFAAIRAQLNAIRPADENRTPTWGDKPKFYALGMFPYPSGHAHMGHVRVYTITDVMARYKRLKGFDALNPIGWDAFGLPAENAAIQRGVRPDAWTAENVRRMKEEQFVDMGWTFDWSREIDTSSPEYYRWTQWLFLKFLERGLAYKKRALVNWCERDQTVLADEQVIDGRCWRDDTPVVKRYMEQWFLRLSEYAPRLWDDLAKLEGWADEAVAVQRNWIRRSDGAIVQFEVEGHPGETLSVFTTRVDTLFGVTALVLAPEHPLVAKLVEPNDPRVREYVAAAVKKSSVERQANKDKTGVRTSLRARHCFTGRSIEVWVGDYVLAGYGTSAVMAVPAHDQRDLEFAHKHGLDVIEVVRPAAGGGPIEATAFTDDGVLVNSGEFDGLTSAVARARITDRLLAVGRGEGSTTYNLRDWSVGRQRYWGAPIPVIECAECGPVGVPFDQLPVRLPTDVNFEGGKAVIPPDSSFHDVTCPKCGKQARRETDTLDTFVCSSWYAFRFLDPHNEALPFDPAIAARWMPIDFYVGGLEHAGQHMIYFRFVTKFLHDVGMLAIDEPVDRFFCNGMVLKNGEKMSKSKGNVVVPTEIVERYGSDALRLYILSDTPAELPINWDESGILGKASFLKRNYRAISEFLARTSAERVGGDPLSYPAKDVLRRFYTAIDRLSSQIADTQFHTAVATLHELSNTLLPALDAEVDANARGVLRRAVSDYLVVFGLFAPYFAGSLLLQLDAGAEAAAPQWPTVDPRVLENDLVEIVVQINGRKRGVIEVAKGASAEDVEAIMRVHDVLAPYLQDATIKKRIFVPNRIMNIVVS